MKGDREGLPKSDPLATVDLDRPRPTTAATKATADPIWSGPIGQFKRLSLRDEVVELIVGMIRAGDLKPSTVPTRL